MKQPTNNALMQQIAQFATKNPINSTNSGAQVTTEMPAYLRAFIDWFCGAKNEVNQQDINDAVKRIGITEATSTVHNITKDISKYNYANNTAITSRTQDSQDEKYLLASLIMLFVVIYAFYCLLRPLYKKYKAGPNHNIQQFNLIELNLPNTESNNNITQGTSPFPAKELTTVGNELGGNPSFNGSDDSINICNSSDFFKPPAYTDLVCASTEGADLIAAQLRTKFPNDETNANSLTKLEYSPNPPSYEEFQNSKKNEKSAPYTNTKYPEVNSIFVQTYKETSV